MEGVKRKDTMQGDARPMLLVRHHGRGGRDCKQVEGLLHADKDPRPHLHHRPNPHHRPNILPKPYHHLNP